MKGEINSLEIPIHITLKKKPTKDGDYKVTGDEAVYNLRQFFLFFFSPNQTSGHMSYSREMSDAY